MVYISKLKLTMAQALIKFMDSQYIEFDGKVTKFVDGVFGVFGHGCVTGIGQALEQGGHELKFYQGKNEQGMAHAAIAYAKQSDRLKVMACTSSIGPGAMNMVTAAATATVNRLPLILLPGDYFACSQPDPVLQQLEYSYTKSESVNDAFKPVCAYWDRIERPQQLMTSIINAFRVLTDPADCGAVCLAMPQDVESESYEYPDYFFKKRIWRIDRRPPSESAVEIAVSRIKKSKKPMIICGGGVRYSGAYETLKEFALKFSIPIGETQSGKGGISCDFEWNMGGVGLTGTSCANITAQKADLIIGIGTRLMDFTTCSKWLFQNSEVELLSINVNGMDAIKMDSFPLIADAKEALIKISDKLEDINYKSGYNYIDEIKKIKDSWNLETERLYNMKNIKNKLAATRVLGILNSFMDENDVVLTAGGSLPSDLQRIWKCKNPGTYHVEYGFSCMGYEVCGALGCKMAIGDQRQVYALAGDGSYLLLHSELYTAIQEGIKINILVFDNSGWGCIENLQNSQGTATYGTVFKSRNKKTGLLDGREIPVDFAMNARSYGAVGYSVKTQEELKAALNDSKKQKLPCVFDIKVAPGSMTEGYNSWWRVGVAEVSENEHVREAYLKMQKNINESREY